MAKSVLVLMATGVLLVPVLCYFAALATPGRPYGGAGAPVYVGGGVRPVIARPGDILGSGWCRSNGNRASMFLILCGLIASTLAVPGPLLLKKVIVKQPIFVKPAPVIVHRPIVPPLQDEAVWEARWTRRYHLSRPN
uniref:Uncharacterized protein n=1 Tax=Anopheles melas TaxID=34690 RepID=A0A182UD89_9DIPT